ncbi:MAG: prepilin-type N-terminal cleavage/methylation domain-containing protein [Patescibacteria group bacterium]
MKEQYTKFATNGFSTIELLIALALMSLIMVGALQAVWGNQYWMMTATTAQEAMQKSKSMVVQLEYIRSENFQLVSSTRSLYSVDPHNLSEQDCSLGGLCYQVETKVTDISSCAKSVVVDVRWKLGVRYATSSIPTQTYLVNPNEIGALGGDCLVVQPKGRWGETNMAVGSELQQSPLGTTGIDVLGNYMYVTSEVAPYFRVFEISNDITNVPVLVGVSTSTEVRLNDIDVIRDLPTGRIYAYVTQHSTSSQLLVYDVTESNNPVSLVQLSLYNVASSGSFPQGWRVIAYGGKLYVVSRETTGPELHIFSLDNPRLPVEITTASINLNRTVNDMVVRDEIVGNTMRRFLYLAASADLKEVGVYDVTGTVPIEVAAINLAGSADASSIYLTGSTVYVGRKSSSAPELYSFENQKLIAGELGLRGSGEVGTEILALGGVGTALVLGTAKNGEELQLWSPNETQWSTTSPNAGRLQSLSSQRLSPLGFDIHDSFLYAVSESLTQPESISVVYSP